MAAQGPARGGVGWAILAIALAVPGFLFYNWWSHLKAEQAKAVAAKAHARVEGAVFQTPSTTSGRLINPITASSGTAGTVTPPPAVAGAVAPPPPAPAAAPAMTAPGQSAAPPPAGAGAAAPTPAASPAGGNPPAASAAAPSSTASASTVSTTTITLSRDPMMSPMDLVRIREDEIRKAEDAERIRREAEEAKRPHKTVRAAPVKEKPIEKSIELQGIVATPDGATLAIVNGATVNEGESFTVEGRKEKVKVIRISSSDVTFMYKTHKFKMSVNAE